MVDPEVPVTVTVYVPAVVPEPVPPLLPAPPQLERPPVKNASRISMPSMARQPRRRAGMPNSSTQARVPPAAYQGTGTPPALGWSGWLSAALVAAAVLIVSVEVCAVAPEMVTEVGERLHVAGLLAAVGLTAQLKLTAPLNPFDPVVLIVAVLPVVAPGLTVMFLLLLRAKLGFTTTAVTVTVTAAEVLPLKLVSPP